MKEGWKMARTHEQRLKAIEEANKKNIVEVAQSLGMGLINQGQSYTWNEHDSFVITPRKNAFYWNSESVGGGVIQLVKLIKKCENKEAIDYLNNMEVGTFEEIQETKKAPFHYYMKEHTNKTVSMNYLTNERKLSEETVQFFISKGLLAQTTYKDKKTGETEPAIVFKHKDLGGEIKGIALQGIWENKEIHGERGKLKKTYGDGFYGMSVRVGNSDKATLTSENPLRIIAFEAPIDLMSYYDLFKDTIGDAVLLSMNGLRKGTIAKFIANEIGSALAEEEKPKLLDKLQLMGANLDQIEVTLAVDNDKAGKLFVDKFGISCLPVHSELPPILEGRDKSDWNDLLKESKLGKEMPGELTVSSNTVKDTAVKQTVSESYEKQTKAEGKEPLLETKEITSEPLLLTEKGWEGTMDKKSNIGLLQVSQSNYLSDFKKALDDVLDQMEQKEEGTSEYLTKVEVEGLLNEHLTKVEQLVSHYDTSFDLVEKPTEEEKTSLLRGLLDTIAATIKEFKNELVKTLTTKKNNVIYNVQDKTDDLRLNVKNSINSRILKANEPVKKLVEKIDSKFVLEDKVVRPHPNEKSKIESSLEEEAPSTESVIAPKIEVVEKEKEIGEPSLVELVREYSKLTEVNTELSNAIYQEIQKNPLAKLDDLQEKLVANQAQIKDYKQKIIDKSSLESPNETKEQEQSRIEKLAELVKQKDQLTKERNSYVDQPDFLRSSLSENPKPSLDQFKRLDEKIAAVDKEIESIEKNGPVAEAATEKDVEPVVEPVVEREEKVNPNDPFLLATTPVEKIVDKEIEKNETTVASGEKSFKEIVESQDLKSLSSNLANETKDLLNVDSLKNYLNSVNHFHSYSASNVQLITKQDPEAIQVASQNKWEKLGYEIKNDAQKIYVYAPDIQPVLNEQGQPVLDAKGKEKTTVEFYLKPVYDVSQTTADKETLPSSIRIERPEEFTKAYHALMDCSKATMVDIGPLNGNENGQYNLSENKITIRQGLGAEQTLKTLIQENARLSLADQPKGKQVNHSQEVTKFEIEAVTYIVSSHLGMDTSEYSFDSLNSLKERNIQIKDFSRSLDRVNKQASVMIKEVDTNFEKSKEVSGSKNKFEERVAQARKTVIKQAIANKNQEETFETKQSTAAMRR